MSLTTIERPYAFYHCINCEYASRQIDKEKKNLTSKSFDEAVITVKCQVDNFQEGLLRVGSTVIATKGEKLIFEGFSRGELAPCPGIKAIRKNKEGGGEDE